MQIVFKKLLGRDFSIVGQKNKIYVAIQAAEQLANGLVPSQTRVDTVAGVTKRHIVSDNCRRRIFGITIAFHTTLRLSITA